MSLDPTVNLSQVGVALSCGFTACVMHVVTVTSGDTIPIRRKLVSDTIRTFVVGVAVALLIDWQTFMEIKLLPALVISAVIGAVLGPRGLRWLFAGLVAILAIWYPAFKPPKEDGDA